MAGSNNTKSHQSMHSVASEQELPAVHAHQDESLSPNVASSNLRTPPSSMISPLEKKAWAAGVNAAKKFQAPTKHSLLRVTKKYSDLEIAAYEEGYKAQRAMMPNYATEKAYQQGFRSGKNRTRRPSRDEVNRQYRYFKDSLVDAFLNGFDKAWAKVPQQPEDIIPLGVAAAYIPSTPTGAVNNAQANNNNLQEGAGASNAPNGLVVTKSQP